MTTRTKLKTPADCFSLDGRVALVTGASSGLGAHFAEVLAGAGAKVVCAARRVDRVRALAQAIVEAGGQAHGCAIDVTDAASIKAAFDEAEEVFGAVDILVNNAGATGPAPYAEMGPEHWDPVVDVNLSAPFRISQAMARRLIALGKRGVVINIASILGHLAYPNFTSYGVTKGALMHLTRYMALDLLKHGIRVNAIAPGYFPSEMTNPFFESEAGKKEIAGLPPGRLGRLEELDGPLLLLASEASSYMSGSVVTVDYCHSVRLS